MTVYNRDQISCICLITATQARERERKREWGQSEFDLSNCNIFAGLKECFTHYKLPTQSTPILFNNTILWQTNECKWGYSIQYIEKP